MTEEFNHDKWVEQMVEQGHMTPAGEETYTPGQDGPVKQPDLADRAAAEEEAAKAELDGQLSQDSASEGGVEVKYLGHGAYDAEGVEVKRNGQTISVDETKAAALTGLQDESGNALFERV